MSDPVTANPGVEVPPVQPVNAPALPESVRRFLDIMFQTRQAGLSSVILVAGVLVVFGVLVIAAPPIAHRIVPSGFAVLVKYDATTWKLWVDYAKLALESLIAVCIGGTVFADSMKSSIRGKLERAATKLDERAREQMEGRRTEIETLVSDFQTASQRMKLGVRGYLQGILELALLAPRGYRLLYGLYHWGPWINLQVMLLNFPGGLFGFGAYSLLLLLTVLKCLKLYIDGL
jgi:hypothetical protein